MFSIWSILHIPGKVKCQPQLEPADGSIIMGISLTNSFESNGKYPFKPMQTLLSINNLTGFLWGAYQVIQEIPQVDIPPFEYFDQSRTDAAVYLTVLPIQGLEAISGDHLIKLVQRCAEFNRRGRHVFLRFGPEMNLQSHPWGFKPTKFKEIWIKLYMILRSISDANKTVMIWAPFEGNAYLNGYSPSIIDMSDNDIVSLDTNLDGLITSDDDPYSPYFPGKEMIDWVGLSLYWRPGKSLDSLNQNVPPTYVQDVISGKLGNTTDFYKIYANWANKPMMLADSGAFYYRKGDINADGSHGISEANVKRSWWRQMIKDPSFRSFYPKLKFICFTETWVNGINNETGFLLDSRITANPEVLKEFKIDIKESNGLIFSKRAILNTFDLPTPVLPNIPSSPTINIFANVVLTAVMVLAFFAVVVWVLFICWKQFYEKNRPEFQRNTIVFVENVDDSSTIYCESIRSTESQLTTTYGTMMEEDLISVHSY